MAEEKKEQTRVVLVEGKLSKIIHAEGQGESPQKGQEVHALYRGTLQTGEQFDSNLNRDSPFTFTIGQGQVIKGWDEGFASMKIGEKATLICSPQYAYGARGSPPKIPPNSTLHFEVQLLGFNDKKKEKWDLSDEEKVSEATKLKNQGNDLLKEGQFANAAKKYEEGIEFVDGEQNEDAKSILKVLRMNASQAYIKTKQYAKSIKLATEVLKEDPDNLKTLYRRGISYSANQDFDLAKVDIERLIALDASNSDAKQELVKIAQAKRAAAEKEKKVFGGMFAKSGLYEDKKQSQAKQPQAKDEDYEEIPDEPQQETPGSATQEAEAKQ